MISIVFCFYLTPSIGQDLLFEESQILLNHSHLGAGGGGLSTIDFNRDGYDDLSLAGSKGKQSQFYINTQGNLQDTLLTGVNNVDEVKQLLWIDIDNDGDYDLFLTCKESQNKLYINQGELVFEEALLNYGLGQPQKNNFGAAFLDIDRDGFLDLYYAERPYTNLSGDNHFRLYKNNSGKHFTEVTSQYACGDKGKRPFGTLVIDANKDLYPDILNAHDRGNGNSLFVNEHGKLYRDISIESNICIDIDAMGMTSTDLNKDGFEDIYISNIDTGNKLYLSNQSDSILSFTEQAESYGLVHNKLGWSTQFFDANNDGRDELYIVHAATAAEHSNVLYQSNADSNYTPHLIIGDTLSNFSSGTMDLDNDQRLDIINAGVYGDQSKLYINKSEQGNVISISLRGKYSNIDGIGSWITIHQDSKKATSYTRSCEGFLTQLSNKHHFGLSSSEQIDSIVVWWPTGHTDRLYNITPNQHLEIIEGSTSQGVITVDQEVEHLYVANKLFTDVTSTMQINHFVYHSSFHGGGCAFFDSDNDGDDDLYVIGGLNADKLYVNNDSIFEEDGFFSGIGITNSFYTTGVSPGDFNNDGLEDLFVTTNGSDSLSRKNLLLVNLGNNTFQDVWSFVDTIGYSFGASLFDFNLDGLLDIVVMNYVQSPKFVYDEDGQIIGYDHTCYQNTIYENLGNFQFKLANGDLLPSGEGGCSLASLASDYDKDGDTDLIEVNDFGSDVQPNRLLTNNYPERQFLSNGDLMNFEDGIYGMGISGSDIDNDLDIDYYITNFGKNILKLNHNGVFDNGHDSLNIYSELNSQDTSLQSLSISWGVISQDFDNNGHSDLLIGNGYVPSPNFIPGKQLDHDRLYMNQGELNFVEPNTFDSGIDNLYSTRGIASSDFDNDGDVDFFANVMRIPVHQSGINSKLYRNNGQGDKNYIQVKLTGSVSNNSACGAKIEIYAKQHHSIQEIHCGSSFASSNSKVIHFGLDTIKVVDSIKIYWPSKHYNTETLVNPNINTRHYVVEDDSFLNEEEEEEEEEEEFSDGGIMAQLPIIKSDALLRESTKESQSSESHLIFPNPTTNNQLTIMSESQIEGFGLLSPSGKDLAADITQMATQENNYLYHVSIDLPSGIYFVRYRVGGQYHTHRIVIINHK